MSPFNDANRKWWVLAAMGMVLGLIVLDETVIGVALPTIREDLATSEVASHWVVSSYLITLAGFAMAAGKLGDIFGLRRVFLAGCGLFIASSLAAGFASSGLWLILARLLQGIGAAAIFPASFAIITLVFPPQRRGLAFGIQTGVACSFISLGPIVGGYFTEAISWRWIFWMNAPIVAVAALILVSAWQGPARTGKPPALDLPGLVTLVVGLGATVLAAMQSPDWGWSAATIVSLVVGLLCLGLFVRLELKARHPLVRLALFAQARFTGASLVIFAGQVCKLVVIIFGALYLQVVLHKSPLEAGLGLLPAVLPTALGALAAGRLSDRLGERRPALIGLACNVLALLGLGWAAPAESYALLVAPLLLWGASSTFCFVPIRRILLNSVAEAERGQVGGIALTAQLLGGIFGMALCGTLLAITNDFRSVSLAAAAFCGLMLVVGLVTIRDDHTPLHA